jgi:hypothetical protein
MIAHKKKFFSGFGLLASFGVVLALLFSNVFPGPNNTKQNGLNYLDSLYNSISKDSAYNNNIPPLKKKAVDSDTVQLTATIKMTDAKQATQTALLFEKAGAEATVSGEQIAINGKLGKIFASCLEDADNMYKNDGKTISSKYGMDERQVLYNWHTAFKVLAKELNRQQKFKDAKEIDTISKKAVEFAYNYYTIEPLKISENIGLVTFSLVFYVIYTMWFGFAVLFMFEGWGLKLEH